MPWLLIDLAIVALALGVLVVLCLRLYGQVKALLRATSRAGQVLGPAASALSRAQAAGERQRQRPDVP